MMAEQSIAFRVVDVVFLFFLLCFSSRPSYTVLFWLQEKRRRWRQQEKSRWWWRRLGFHFGHRRGKRARTSSWSLGTTPTRRSAPRSASLAWIPMRPAQKLLHHGISPPPSRFPWIWWFHVEMWVSLCSVSGLRNLENWQILLHNLLVALTVLLKCRWRNAYNTVFTCVLCFMLCMWKIVKRVKRP